MEFIIIMSKKENKQKSKKNLSDSLTLAAMNAKENFSKVDKKSKNKFRDILLFVGATIVAMIIFFFFVNIGKFIPIFIAYIVIWSVLILVYWIYNRGMISADIEPESLSPYWSKEKKEQFIASVKERRKKTRWLLFVIAPITFVFLVYFVLDFLLPDLYEKFIVNKK